MFYLCCLKFFSQNCSRTYWPTWHNPTITIEWSLHWMPLPAHNPRFLQDWKKFTAFRIRCWVTALTISELIVMCSMRKWISFCFALHTVLIMCESPRASELRSHYESIGRIWFAIDNRFKYFSNDYFFITELCDHKQQEGEAVRWTRFLYSTP